MAAAAASTSKGAAVGERLPKIPDDEFSWVETYLEAWARSMHSDQLGEGYPDHSPVVGGAGFGGYKTVIDDWQEEADERSTAIIDMMMGPDSKVLTPIEKMAVLHVKRCAVVRFEREPVEVIYPRARVKIGHKLQESDFS